MQKQLYPYGTNRAEIMLLITCFMLMSILYGLPRLLSHGLTAGYAEELLIDCAFMVIACLPVWWLHFRIWADGPLKRRLLLHMATAVLYYTIWVLLYQLYNPFDGKPRMDGLQMLQNSGPNLLFYIQVFSILHIYHFFHEREAQLNREKELKELAYQGEIKALKAQIQPHFLFNTLNSISASVPPEQESTRILIAQLADTFRYALASTKEELVPLSAELDFMHTYLSLEKVRFGHRLEFKISADSDVGRVPVPPMLIQPLVENAVKHAIEPAIAGGMISISCQLKGEKVHIMVSNTGQPYEGNLDQLLRGKGVGLCNVGKRLQRHFGETLSVSFNDARGLLFEFYVPCITEIPDPFLTSAHSTTEV